MEEIIVNILESLNIEIGMDELDTTESLDEYIVFSIYNDKDSNICDEGNLSETYYISVNYWFKSMKNLNKHKEIKSLLKKHGFIYNDGKRLKSEGVHGKNMDFIYVIDISE